MCNTLNKMSRDGVSWWCSSGSTVPSRTHVFHPASLPSSHLTSHDCKRSAKIPSFGSTLNSSQNKKESEGNSRVLSPRKSPEYQGEYCFPIIPPLTLSLTFPLPVLDHTSTFGLIKEHQFIIQTLNQS